MWQKISSIEKLEKTPCGKTCKICYLRKKWWNINRGCSRHPQCIQPYEEQLAKRQEVAVDVRIFFSRKRNLLNIKSNTMWFFEKYDKRNILREQNVNKSGLNIIPARDVKMRWIKKIILQNPKRQFKKFINSKHA